uniref:Putative secreted peptide n=1 Tax=Anopheles braziliensis TaxID=58242 RepID=A0A2M3ZQ17_9DIPT
MLRFRRSVCSSSPSIACWAAWTSLSVDLITALPAACNRRPVSELGSDFTLQAISSWAVELATCFADEMSISSVPTPCTRFWAASTRLWAAAATNRAADINPSDH